MARRSRSAHDNADNCAVAAGRTDSCGTRKAGPLGRRSYGLVRSPRAFSRHRDEGRAGLRRSLWFCGQREARNSHNAASFSNCQRDQTHHVSGDFTPDAGSQLRLTDHVFGPNSILGDEYKTPPNRQDIERITIEHLLTHTSGGWPNDHDDPMFKNKEMSHRELINWALETEPLRWEPGYRYAYSNFGYCLLGRVIEKIAN